MSIRQKLWQKQNKSIFAQIFVFYARSDKCGSSKYKFDFHYLCCMVFYLFCPLRLFVHCNKLACNGRLRPCHHTTDVNLWIKLFWILKIFTLKFVGHLHTKSLNIPQQKNLNFAKFEFCRLPKKKAKIYRENVYHDLGRCDTSGVLQCTELRKPSLSFNWFRFDFGAVEYWFNRSVYTIFFFCFR